MCRYKIVGFTPNGEEWEANSGYSDPYDAQVAANHWTKLEMKENSPNKYRVEYDDGY